MISTNYVTRLPSQTPQRLIGLLISLTLHAIVSCVLMFCVQDSGRSSWTTSGSQVPVDTFSIQLKFGTVLESPAGDDDDTADTETPVFVTEDLPPQQPPSRSFSDATMSAGLEKAEEQEVAAIDSKVEPIPEEKQDQQPEILAQDSDEMESEEGPAIPASPPGPELALSTPGKSSSNLSKSLAAVRIERLQNLIADSQQIPAGIRRPGSKKRSREEGNDNGDTSFFEVAATGRFFSFVVDSSSSMENENIFRLVRNELVSSIHQLPEEKQFQVLFYDSDLHLLMRDRQDKFIANSANRMFARQFIEAQQPTSGTQHKPALLRALKSKPDVIYLLTDGDEPELSAFDLKELKGANRGHSKIHVIEFGRGPKLGLNWLDQLAEQHHGVHRYLDVAEYD